MLVGLRPPNRATIRLVAVVIAWWLLLIGLIVLLVAASMGADETPTVVPGQAGHLAMPSGGAWLMPIDRVTYDEVEQPSSGDVEDAEADVRARSGWLPGVDGQSVRVVDVDRAAVQVELPEEPNIGGQGWLHLNHLRP